MPRSDRWLQDECRRRGLSRREFLEFCGAVAAALSLPKSAAAEIAKAVGRARKPGKCW